MKKLLYLSLFIFLIASCGNPSVNENENINKDSINSPKDSVPEHAVKKKSKKKTEENQRHCRLPIDDWRSAE